MDQRRSPGPEGTAGVQHLFLPERGFPRGAGERNPRRSCFPGAPTLPSRATPSKSRGPTAPSRWSREAGRPRGSSSVQPARACRRFTALPGATRGWNTGSFTACGRLTISRRPRPSMPDRYVPCVSRGAAGPWCIPRPPHRAPEGAAGRPVHLLLPLREQRHDLRGIWDTQGAGRIAGAHLCRGIFLS